jgi:hypothetical protein
MPCVSALRAERIDRNLALACALLHLSAKLALSSRPLLLVRGRRRAVTVCVPFYAALGFRSDEEVVDQLPDGTPLKCVRMSKRIVEP